MQGWDRDLALRAVIFAKQSRRLPGKHLMDVCGEPMLRRVYGILERTALFEQVTIFSKYQQLALEGCEIERDLSDGALIDSIVSAIKTFGEFMAVGGDLPLLDRDVVAALTDCYHGEPLAAVDSEGMIEPLFALYNTTVYDDLMELSRTSKRIHTFIERRFQLVRLDSGLSSRLLNVNTREDLERVRVLLNCH